MFFFFNDTATTEIYTLSLHDALPIFRDHRARLRGGRVVRLRVLQRPSGGGRLRAALGRRGGGDVRSEEHTSELQSRSDLVCRLLLEKKKTSSASPIARVRTFCAPTVS